MALDGGSEAVRPAGLFSEDLKLILIFVFIEPRGFVLGLRQLRQPRSRQVADTC